CFFFSRRRPHWLFVRDWGSDVCSSDLSSAPGRRALRSGRGQFPARGSDRINRKSVGKGKRVDFGGRRIIKKKKETAAEWPRRPGLGAEAGAMSGQAADA